MAMTRTKTLTGSMTGSLKYCAALLFALGLATSALAQVYKTTDENGRVVFTDTPTKNAETVEIRETNTAPPIKPVIRQNIEQKAALNYQVRITGPTTETHLQPGERDLTIRFEANQPLARGLRFQVLSNGNPVAESTTGNSVLLPEIERGEHSFTVAIYDDRGYLLAESDPVVVYVHRTTKPKPKPKPAKHN